MKFSFLRKAGCHVKEVMYGVCFFEATTKQEQTSHGDASIRYDVVLIYCSSRGLEVRMTPR